MRAISGVLVLALIVGCDATPPPTASPGATATLVPTSSTEPSPTTETTATTSASPQPPFSPAPSVSPTPLVGCACPGTSLYLLMSSDAPNGGTQFQDMDPQRIYTGEDLAFFGATIMRSLTGYTHSADALASQTLVGDAATDIGTANADFTQWTFTLRDGMKWQDGSDLTCEDFKYGVSRTFATDLIVGGPQYAIAYLAIPTDDDGSSKYKGPYDGRGQDLFDGAVTCNGPSITYRLNKPVPDFNYTVTLGFGAVPNPVHHPGADTQEEYDQAPWSDGPYVITSYSPGAGGSLILDRNLAWTPDVDPYRPAWPDKWEVDFGLDSEAIDRTLIADTGNGRFALKYGAIDTHYLSQIYVDPLTPADAYEGRAFSSYDGYARYIWIRTDSVPNEKIRQAMAVALNRYQIREAEGDEYGFDFADGVLVPTIGMDYAPTHLWDAAGPFGQAVAVAGSTELAKQLIAQSGEAAPTVTYGYSARSSTSTAVAEVVRSSLHAAGFSVELFDWPSYGIPDEDDFGMAGWGAEWPNASTVIPTLFTDAGGFNLSHVSRDAYPDFYADVDDALTTSDRHAQAAKWQELNATAMEQAFVIPLFYGRDQHLAGSQVGGLYRWPAFASWPYAELYAKDS